MLIVALSLLAVAAGAASLESPTSPSSTDAVLSLPTYGKLQTTQYAGFVNGTADGDSQLFYWFAESDRGNAPDVPLLLWLNGGPGASSITGLLLEKLGPLSMTLNSTLVDNPDRLTKNYHVLIFDNPVGSGYSYTTAKRYVRSEYEMRTQLVHALRLFFKLHPEYTTNKFWVTGESYAGHYVPNIAWEIAVNATEIPLQGVAIGNGMYNMKLQYPSVGPMAYSAGVIDERTLTEMGTRQDDCVAMIDSSPATAGAYCENVTVFWLYSQDGPGGQIFYYDVGIADGRYFDTLTEAMAMYLNREDTKAALHTQAAVDGWRQADEVGPVADNLLADWTANSDDILVKLLERNLKVRLYNGVRDLSSCNHLGNLAVLLNLEWAGKAVFKSAPFTPWPSGTQVDGHMRRAGLLEYATVLRTGHLVPTVVPDVFAALLADFLRDDSAKVEL